MGGDVDTTTQEVSFRTSRLGSYQVRQATRLSDVSLVQVYPRIFTPNGDGANDVVVFQFGEGNLDGKTISGEIFDLSGTKVADLSPGPDPSVTLIWDGKASNGSLVSGGIYVYQISVNGVSVNGTVVVAK